ncbi:acyltransferase family protein [Sporosarcina luteola]|uniref:acyltransferase family protein n=1 Tax=Sporosarcina luteola TaxID=582850 RepID=UPI0020410B99|nr:acyltransferase family protein [Sporosarcina luteola]MCM3744583.1 acyltransferase family protein [Sporosarcina luteola]
MNNNQIERHYDLDWIKVFAMLLVFLYHCSMFFNSFEWHIKNNIINSSIEFFSLLIGNWIMPIFFVISGIATFHALKKRNTQSYIRERLLRLGIPLILGIFLLSPPQVYIERIANNQYEGTYFQFYPHYFDGLYLEIGGTGNFAFFGHHLWYLLALLLFSLLTLPFFLKPRENAGEKVFGYFHYLFMPIPLIVSALTTNTIVNLGGGGLVFYFILYVYGYYFFTRGNLREFIRRVGIFAGFLSVLSMAGYIFLVMYNGFPMSLSLNWAIFIVIRVIMVWNVVFYILFLGDKFLNVSNGVLKYTSEAAMPFYVLHQPIIIIIGFFIYNLEWDVFVKAAFLVSIAFTIIMILYHFIIRRFNVLRVLFGLRRIDKEVSL